uniref:Thioredoxin domain-containing protein n=2 Tax=Spongospora subterranea TaxID=70186 RepID=A0A0H5QNI0_9EUKA|eukprot:CRZ02941.1 hypothetical protein [Spongospora subterranea]
MQKLGRAVALIDKARDVGRDPPITTIFVSVDPHRDTPPVLANYKKEYDPGMVALTGSIGDITTLAKRYRVYFSAPEGDDQDYMVDHSLFTYFVGLDGQVIDIFGRDMSAEEIAGKVASVMVQDRAAAALSPVSSPESSLVRSPGCVEPLPVS